MLRFILTRIAMTVPTLAIVGVSVFVLYPAHSRRSGAAHAWGHGRSGEPCRYPAEIGPGPAAAGAVRAVAGAFVPGRSWPVDHHTASGAAADFRQRFAVSAQIVLVAVLLASLIAVPAGVIAAWRQNSLTDLALVGTATVLLSIPTFWLGLLLLLLFGLKLGWLPVLGYVSIGDNLVGGLLYLVLPVMTLVIHEMGVLIRMARASTLEVLRLDYITHARAKGRPKAPFSGSTPSRTPSAPPGR